MKSKLPLYLFAVVLLALVFAPAPATGSTAFNFQWSGTPSKPMSVVPSAWDTQIHVRPPGDTMDSMQAGHGPDCGAPPSTHIINQLKDSVFICRNHLMTATSGGPGYSEIALTPDHLADWSSGTVSIKVDVSTLQLNSSDFLEIWVTPFADNQTVPMSITAPDGQGSPKNAIKFDLNYDGPLGGYEGDVIRYDNFVPTKLHKARGGECYMGKDCLAGLGLSSATARTTYEIDISSTHVRFGLPGYNLWWTDTDVSALPYNQAVVSLTHHSYTPAKHNPGHGIDTWHWSNFNISNAVPFTIINGTERSIHCSQCSTTLHFPIAAPANSYLRFSGIGTVQISYNGGATWQAAQKQSQKADTPGHFSSYWTKMPAGVSTVLFMGTDWYGGPWWVRDPAIWSLTPPGGSQPPPTPTPTPKVSPPPTPNGIPINGVPCTVTLNGKTVVGKCSGTFWPK